MCPDVIIYGQREGRGLGGRWGGGADHLGFLGHDKEFSFIPIQWEAMEELKEEKQGMIS